MSVKKKTRNGGKNVEVKKEGDNSSWREFDYFLADAVT
jgi:hypothetical protein